MEYVMKRKKAVITDEVWASGGFKGVGRGGSLPFPNRGWGSIATCTAYGHAWVPMRPFVPTVQSASTFKNPGSTGVSDVDCVDVRTVKMIVYYY